MAHEPGNLNHLTGAGQTEWDARVANLVAGAIAGSGTAHLSAAATPEMGAVPDVVDWSAIPVRVQTCLRSRDKAMELADWTEALGDAGRSGCHEEYLEWRAVRDAAGRVVRFEGTSEAQDYWAVLARHEPSRVLELLGQFAGEGRAAAADVYGSVNPFAPDVTLAQREAGFRSMMLPSGGRRSPRSPYNNGIKAIAFMYQSVNTISAAVQLAAFAAVPYAVAVAGGGTRPLTGAEAIASTRQEAVDCRNSDPTIVGGVVGLAYAGKRLALDDPAGVYVTQADPSRLLRPWDGDSPVPAQWFTLSRGTPSADGKPRHQRVVFQVPPETGKTISDLIDADTGEQIRFGWQIARSIRVGLYVRATGAGAVPGGPTVVALRPITACADANDCRFFREEYAEFDATRPPPVPPPGGRMTEAADPADLGPTRAARRDRR